MFITETSEAHARQDDDSPMFTEAIENSWISLPVNLAEASEDPDKPAAGVYKPSPAWERPAGHAMQGINAMSIVSRNLLSLYIGDSGATPTLISKDFLDRLKLSKPKPCTGRKLKLLQLTGSAGCSEYMRLNLYFHSQLGPVCLKGMEAYVVKDMKADMLISEDMQRAWQLHTIRSEQGSFWQVGDSLHHILVVLVTAPAESFSARWAPESELVTKPHLLSQSKQEVPKGPWKVLAKNDLTIEPEFMTSLTAVSKGAPKDEPLYLDAIPLNRGLDLFIAMLHSIVDVDDDFSFPIKITNTAECHICICCGELLSFVTRAKDALWAAASLSESEQVHFDSQASQLAILVLLLDACKEQTLLTTENATPEFKETETAR